MHPAPINPRDLRVSDAEREHVVTVLQKAIGRGLLDLDEFTRRTDTALASRTRAELNAVLVDLPGITHTDSGPASTRPVEFRNTMSSTKRDGRWVVPRSMRIYNRMGSTELDFTDAVIQHAEVHVEVDLAGGAVELLLPDGASVLADEVNVIAGSVTNKTAAGAGTPRFVVTGSVTAGSLTLRKPKYVRIGNMVVRRPWKVSWES
ncbi:DUF1707 domain-containing protein [Actinokineospora sp. UTMC 2448]|uniref:DUF1707 SHOCT-like domain-containing protein n=1 Tax=Actinokineospora sp. UTMC 2448 TaxID=2268449 RepID=UPI002164514D|nr:DUF1707 domain-containing protein [Actinokineospora sp. UTMC 2448]UVS82682.1 hypothetical protein Actkin_06456 [Actinokineospora sp. UTMC 2448]